MGRFASMAGNGGRPAGASVHGEDAEPAEAAGAEFAAFCAEPRDEIADILRTRLVQTSAPGRGAGAPARPRRPRRRCASASAVVVFHSMVTVHVPRERLPAFDAAIEAL